MSSKNSRIRERRYDRIRQVMEGHADILPPHREIPKSGRPEEVPLVLDPEVEWNRKWERDWQEYRRYGEDPPRDDRWVPGKSRIRLHLVLSGVLFAMVWGIFQVDHPLAEKGRSYVRAALTQSMDLNGVAAWYDKTFGGSPSFLPAMNPLKHQEAEKVAVTAKHYFPPVQGKVTGMFQPDREGIVLEAKAGSPVSALDTGRVSFAGTREGSGYTVILQHSGKMKSVYGNLEPGAVQVGDWIKGGETVGVMAKSNGAAAGLFFAVSKNDKYVNPADVVALD
ncbi:M23 family metallopeptidase [Paenibacillus silviterrae]|uniref:M23 family metallopeptidase n=1 Tax=Paenibacillus silviterrae TaxID=3242194 RepID=UPI002542D8AC|nr:M23 family metallopeptidase [Paenibacillus chinjuensis]